MFSKVYLAQTSREMEEYLPERAAYMACHFSPYSAGLSNIPQKIPESSILLLDDSMPIQGHDPNIVTEQLGELISRFSVGAVLLDFQREQTEDSNNMVSALVQALSCPVAVTKEYAAERGCPVFLPPPPVNMPLQAYLAPWLTQGVYLEIAPETLEINVTSEGCNTTFLPFGTAPTVPLEDKRLHCHYNVEVFPEKAVFTLLRTGEDLAALAEEAYGLGAHGVVGLYQELREL